MKSAYAQERLAQIRAPDERRALAKRIARGIFATGEWNGTPAERMAYKFGKNPESEGGGLCEEAMASLIYRLLETAPTAEGRQE